MTRDRWKKTPLLFSYQIAWAIVLSVIGVSMACLLAKAVCS